jgi:membrane fusion protein, heavy metal efflux system
MMIKTKNCTMHRFLALLLALATPAIDADEPKPNPSVQVTPALSARISIEPVEFTQNTDTLRLPGRVALDEHRVARIGPSISGRVVEIKAFIGRNVRKGEVLAVLNSTELSNAQANYLKAKTQMGLQRLAVDRARRLFNEGIISEATLKEREGGLAEAEVEVRAVADQLGIMGMSDAAIERLTQTGLISSITSVTATLSGTVIERHISVGTIAEISDELFTVADLSQVWVAAEAPEQDAHVVQVGNRVEVHIPALPQQHFIGKIVFVADTVHPETRTVTMRMQVDNPQRTIKPGMLADMLIKRSTDSVLTIPAQAVLREADKDHVFVEVDKDRFTLRPVILDADQDGRRRVLSGLTVGERIVVEGAFHLNNVRNLKELE